MFERFTDRARRVLVLAQDEARQLNHGWVGTEHLLLGLLDEGDGLAARALEALDISFDAVRAGVEEAIGSSDTAPGQSLPFTPRAKKVLELSLREALQLGHTYIGTEHILLGLVREGQGVGAQVLIGLGADLPRVRREVIKQISGHGAPASTEVRPGMSESTPSGVDTLRENLEIPGSERAYLRDYLRRLDIFARRGQGTPAGFSASWVLAVEMAGRDAADYAAAFSALGVWLEGRGTALSDLDPTDLAIVAVERDGSRGLQLQVRRDALPQGDDEPGS